MRINHNIAAMNTHRQLVANQGATAKSLEKLSSGLKINRAGDDAAGLAISEKMRGQIRGLDQASNNANDAISLIKTAEGGLNETHSILQRMRELAVQSANGTNQDTDRAEIQKEVQQLTEEITRISADTEFNKQKLLDGDFGQQLKIDGEISNVVLGKGVTGLSGITVTASKAGSPEVVEVSGKNASYTQNLTGVSGGTALSGGSTLTINGKTFATTASGGTVSGALTAINAAASGKFTVALSSGKLTVTSANKTAGEKISISGTLNISGASRAVGAGAPGAAAISGVSASYERTLAGVSGATVLSGGSTLNINGKTVTIASGDTVSGTLTAINAAASGKFTASISASGKLTVTSTSKTAGEVIDISGTLNVSGTGKDVAASGISVSGIADVPATASGGTSVTGIAHVSGQAKVDAKDATVSGLPSGVSFRTEGNKIILSGKVGDIDYTGTSFKVNLKASGSVSKFESTGSDVLMQIGANAGQTIGLSIGDMSAAALGISDVDVSSVSGASLAITTIDDAIASVSSERSKLGAKQNRLEHTINNLGTASENASAAESRIRDVDMAKEMMEFTKNNILSQAAQSMLAQANQQPQGVLQLLQ